jgi:hypothetical protein
MVYQEEDAKELRSFSAPEIGPGKASSLPHRFRRMHFLLENSGNLRGTAKRRFR